MSFEDDDTALMHEQCTACRTRVQMPQAPWPVARIRSYSGHGINRKMTLAVPVLRGILRFRKGNPGARSTGGYLVFGAVAWWSTARLRQPRSDDNA